MIIASSNISMTSQHSLVEQESRQESLKTWRDGQPAQELTTRQDQLHISEQAQSLWEEQSQSQSQSQSQEWTQSLTQARIQVQEQRAQSVVGTQGASVYELSDADKQKIALLEQMLKMLTGKKVKLRVMDPAAWAKRQQVNINWQPGGSVQTVGIQSQAPARKGWGLEYDLHATRFEQEKTSMQAGGAVKTADGRTINFAMDVSMSREFMSRLDVSVRAGDALVDPLVMNLSGVVGDLTEQKYSFDIDSDGTADQISFAGPGSGFLALDRNNDGQINDGGELFGTRSGDGFADLAAFDGDGNSWIDENDAVFDKLRIWMKDPSGQDQLVALGQAGVGAIYLGNVSTEFAVKDAANVQQGQMRSSGVFLRENGSAGVVSQIDLVV